MPPLCVLPPFRALIDLRCGTGLVSPRSRAPRKPTFTLPMRLRGFSGSSPSSEDGNGKCCGGMGEGEERSFFVFPLPFSFPRVRSLGRPLDAMREAGAGGEGATHSSSSSPISASGSYSCTLSDRRAARWFGVMGSRDDESSVEGGASDGELEKAPSSPSSCSRSGSETDSRPRSSESSPHVGGSASIEKIGLWFLDSCERRKWP